MSGGQPPVSDLGGGPAAASRATGTTRGPAISSVDGTRFSVLEKMRSECSSAHDMPYRSLRTYFGS